LIDGFLRELVIDHQMRNRKGIKDGESDYTNKKETFTKENGSYINLKLGLRGRKKLVAV